MSRDRYRLTGTRGVREPHQVEVSVDGEQVELFTLGAIGADGQPNPLARASRLETRVPVPAGAHAIGVTFIETRLAV